MFFLRETRRPLETAMQTTTHTISARILTLIAGGMAVDAAVDAVLGAGTYASLAGDLWDRLNGARS